MLAFIAIINNVDWIEIEKPAPVLNTPHFRSVFGGSDGSVVQRDASGHPRSFEFVALAGMTFRIIRRIEECILQVSHETYPSRALFIDQRFGTIRKGPYRQAKPSLPDFDTILARMQERVGTPYIWGGNWADGIPELLSWYPPQKSLDKHMKILWTLQGLDCSGLLYEATRGATLRNTSQLIYCGNPIDKIEALRPLDMIIYPGHVLFVRDQHTVIESRFPEGVCIADLKERLQDLHSSRQQVSQWPPQIESHKSFIVRRIGF